MNKKMEKKKQPKKKKEEKSRSQTVAMLKGLAVAYAITCIVFIAYGLLLTYTSVSEERIPMVALICTAISAAVAGFDWAKCANSRGILWGILAGVVYGVILFLLQGAAGNGFGFQMTKLTMLLVAIAGGGIGGILGINTKKS